MRRACRGDAWNEAIHRAGDVTDRKPRRLVVEEVAQRFQRTPPGAQKPSMIFLSLSVASSLRA
jgi:hypothetical protein